MIGWITPVISALSALVGGFAGGWLVAYRMGRWRQAVEDRLGVVEERLQKGDPLVETVPLIRTRLDLVVEEIRAMRKEIREDFHRVVSREECDRRHDAPSSQR